MSELKSSSLTGTKTAECSSVERGQIFDLFSNKSVVARQPYWLSQMTCVETAKSLLVFLGY